MSRKYVAEYVTKNLCGVRVLEALNEPSSTSNTTGASNIIIGTHNGSFHCDEAMACGLLRCSENFNFANILRTRDGSLLERCNIVVDVGGVYDAELLRFDHHQPSFHETMTTPKAIYKTRLSSAGLVYKHFGREIIQRYVESALASPYRQELLEAGDWNSTKKNLTEQELDVLFDIVYKNFVEHIDGIDNGIDAFGPAREEDVNPNTENKENNNNNNNNNNKSSSSSCVQNYNVTTTLSDRIGRLLPWWNEPDSTNSEKENKCFLQAVELAAMEFFETLHYYTFAWLPARGIVEAAFLAAEGEVHSSGRVMALRGRFCPWKEHLLDVERYYKKEGHVLFVLFPDKRGWRVQAVPRTPGGFDSRRPLPWRGLRDEELNKISGIDGCVFVHLAGFIGGNATYEGALQMAVKALTLES